MADDNQTILAATNLGLQIMWALTIVLVLFVCLRIFVRTFLVRKVGPDDHAFLWAGVSCPVPRHQHGSVPGDLHHDGLDCFETRT